jgi:hypothetical protein
MSKKSQTPSLSGPLTPGEAGTPNTMSGHPDLTSPATAALPSTQDASYAPQVPGTLTPAQAKRLSGWGALHRGLIQRCWAGKASPREAIKAQCNDCVGEDRQAVAECGDRCCPLWRHRPYQRRRTSSLLLAPIKAHPSGSG